MHEDQAFEDAVDYIHDLSALGWKPGLERFTALCERLGNPQDKLRCVHIGGTNGKGSTTTMVASILKAAGYRVGAYYSPYVYNIRERVQLDGGMISKSAFARLIEFIKPHAAAIGETDMGHPTEFEVKTALGFLYFLEQGVDFAVLEVGLGGRLDATNIVNPLVSAITNVTLDHMDRLGNTIAEIAGEKAGIIKQNGRVVTAVEHDALDVIRRICEEKNVELRRVYACDGDFRVELIGNSPSETRPAKRESDGFSVCGLDALYSGLTLRMAGDFQRLNAATAIAVAEALRAQGVDLPEDAIRRGVESAYIPGRLEVLRERPTLLIDGAHNLDAARNLASALKTYFSCDRLYLVMGMVDGHSIENTVDVLAPLAHKFYATAPDSTRAAAASKVAEAARKCCPRVEEVEPVNEAVLSALRSAGENDLVCVTGSFYTISEVPRPTELLELA